MAESRGSNMHQYEVVGRHKPTERKPDPEVFRMKIFATDAASARSRFWYFLSNLKRIKKANGEIISTREIFEQNPNNVKNYCIWLRYDSRSGTHNMMKEFRDVTINACVEKLYAELSSRHRVRKSSIQIIKYKELKASECQRPNILQFHKSKLTIMPLHRINKPSHKRHASVFKAVRPTTFF